MKSYKSLRTVSLLLKIVAILTLVIGLIYSFTIIDDLFPFLISMFYSIVSFLVLMVFSGIIRIAIDIAEDISTIATNTYVMAQKSCEKKIDENEL